MREGVAEIFGVSGGRALSGGTSGPGSPQVPAASSAPLRLPLASAHMTEGAFNGRGKAPGLAKIISGVREASRAADVRLLDHLFNFSETKVVRDVISILRLYQGRWLAPSLNTTRDALPH